MFNLRLRKSERDLISRAAVRVGAWPSAWVRDVAVAAAVEILELETK
jgi:uncharacterized protein (DUF1778 family)